MESTKSNKNECMCCICYEEDNYYAMKHCNICVDGIICVECYETYEECFYENSYSHCPCPICKNLFVTESIRILVFDCMQFYAYDYCENKFHYKLLSPLIKRFIKNYMETDFFKELQKMEKIQT